MDPVSFTTCGLPRSDQLGTLRAWYSGLFDVEPSGSGAGCPCSTAVWSLPEFGISTVKAPHLTMKREAGLLRSNPIDHWVVTIGGRRTRGSAGGATLDVAPHVPFVVSLGRSLVSQRSADERTHLFLPRDAFRDLAPLLDAAEAQPLNSPLGRLLGDYVLLLRDNLPDLTLSDMSRFTGAVRSMVFACMAPTSDSLKEAGPQINLTKREQIRQFIDDNLRNPGLDTRLLCRELGLSRTQLYRLFEQDHGVAHYVRYRRLLRCYVLLSDPSNALAINVIADMHSFEDASTFSRAFKQEFGHSPRDVRAAAGLGQHIADKRDEAFGEPRTLNEYLKGL